VRRVVAVESDEDRRRPGCAEELDAAMQEIEASIGEDNSSPLVARVLRLRKCRNHAGPHDHYIDGG
jgi:hypothetical protein